VLSLISFQPTKNAGNVAAIRYVIPIVPFCFGLVGLAVWFAGRRFRVVALGLFAVLVCTNLLTLTPQSAHFRWLLPSYVWEIHHPYPTAYSAAVDYIKAHVQPDALVTAVPEYCAYPLMFYLDDHVRFCCLMDTNTVLPRDVLRRLNAPLFGDENFPEWLIAFGLNEQPMRDLNYFARPHLENGRLVRYSYLPEQNLNIYWFDTSRPELFAHTFGPKKVFDPDRESVYVLRRLPAKPVASAPNAPASAPADAPATRPAP
jgi:hypothetical protein